MARTGEQRRAVHAGAEHRLKFERTERVRASKIKPDRAKLFMNGRSQAVRLPLEFRLPGKEVSIRREGEAVILEPLGGRSWPHGYWDRLAELGRDFPADFQLPDDPIPPPIDPSRDH